MDIIEPIFKTIMNAEQIKGEIRTLSRTDKIEICRWIDEEAAIDPLFWIGAAENRTEAAWTPKAFVMSGRNAYHGVLGEVVFAGRNFFASKDGFRIGTESTLEEAMESLILRERFKDKMRDDLVEGGTSSVVYSGISTL